jgi:hypothetical protein
VLFSFVLRDSCQVELLPDPISRSALPCLDLYYRTSCGKCHLGWPTYPHSLVAVPDRHAKMLRCILSRPFAGSAHYAPIAIAINLQVAGRGHDSCDSLSSYACLCNVSLSF